jgi:hypothetical protein
MSLASAEHSATGAGPLGALLGGTSGGNREAQKSPSFGAALALAVRALDSGGAAQVPTDAPVGVEEASMSAATTIRETLVEDATADKDAPTTQSPTEDAAPALPDSAASMAASAVLPAGRMVTAAAPGAAPVADALAAPAADAPVRGNDPVPARSDATTVRNPVAPAEEQVTRTGIAAPVSAMGSEAPIPAAGAAPMAREGAGTPTPSPSPDGEASPVATTATEQARGTNSGAAADRTTSSVGAPPSASSVAVLASSAAPLSALPTPVAGSDAAPSRAVAAQVSPVVLSIVQRPVGTHQLTMTVSPDTLGPVTVRAHISAGGEVRVELLGATDAGREALRAIVTDLRRDLAAVMPHANLTLGSGSGSAADAGTPDRGAQPGAGGAAGDQGSGGRESVRAPSVPVTGGDAARGPAHPSLTTGHAVSGDGLDIFA